MKNLTARSFAGLVCALSKMSVASNSANEKPGHMQTDLAVMSHKLAGSFLFRGVK
jgi:hypothetical protein